MGAGGGGGGGGGAAEETAAGTVADGLEESFGGAEGEDEPEAPPLDILSRTWLTLPSNCD